MKDRKSWKLIQALLVILVLTSCARSKSNPDFSSGVSNLFFQGNPSDSYEKLLKYYRAHPALKEDTSAAWTSYPPLSALSETDEPDTHRFKFEKTATIPSEFDSGMLMISENGHQKPDLDISLSYASTEQALNGYNQIVGRFKTYLPYIDSSSMSTANSYVMYADSTKKLGIRVHCYLMPGINSLSIGILNK